MMEHKNHSESLGHNVLFSAAESTELLFRGVCFVEFLPAALNQFHQRFVIAGVDHFSSDRDINSRNNFLQLNMALCCRQFSAKILEMPTMNPLKKT